MKKDYYLILGIPSNATAEAIKKAYRKLALVYHPDVNPQGKEKFQEIMEAYQFLINPQNRKNVSPSSNQAYRPKPKAPRKPDVYQVVVDEFDLTVNRRFSVRVESHNFIIGSKFKTFHLFGVKPGTKRQYSVELYPVESVEIHFIVRPNAPWEIIDFDLIREMSITWGQFLYKKLSVTLPDRKVYDGTFDWDTLEWVIPQQGTFRTRYSRGDVKIRISLTKLQRLCYAGVNLGRRLWQKLKK